MASAFGGLFIGASAIHAAQRGLDVTGQNIANSATEGYTRQRVDLESIGGPHQPAFWSRYDGVGEGVRVTGVTRMNDEFLEARARAANAAMGETEELAKTMAAIERTFGEPGETGLQAKLADFWNAWGKVGNDPRGEAPRNLTYERASEVANHFNHMADSLQTQWEDTISETVANVTDINTMARDVARLNEAIRHNNIAKVPANELLDQRDLLIKKIATLTGATVKPAELDQNADFNSQAVDVYIGDVKLVDANHANTLIVLDPNSTQKTTDPDYVPTYPQGTEAPKDIQVVWDKINSPATSSYVPVAGQDASITTGRVAGQLAGINTTVPTYLSDLDAVARQLAGVVNEQQTKGFAFTMTGGEVTYAEQGRALFTAGGTDATVANITAANLRLGDNTSPSSLATSRSRPIAQPIGPDGNPLPPAVDADDNPMPLGLDGDNAMDMAAHLSDKDGADAAYSSLVVDLGVQTQSVNRNVLVRQNVVRQAEDARDNVAGVSLNEEMTHLVRYQHSFSAAAKFVGVIDETLQTLINMTR